MTIRNCSLVFLSVLSSVALLGARLPGDNEEDHDRGSQLVTSALVRTADLSADPFSIIPLPWGADALGAGSVEVRARRQLEVRLQGVPANVAYDVLMCGLTALPANRCTVLGAVTADSEGRAREVLDLPAAANTWAAFFALTRGGLTHFVSGFAFLAMPPVSDGAEVEVKGRVVSANLPAGIINIQGFAPLIFIDALTKLKGIDGLAEVSVGSEVEVQGATRADGNLQARELKAKQDKD